MQLSRKLLMAEYLFPTKYTAPTSYTTQQVAATTTLQATYTTYDVPEDGWYYVHVRAGAGGSSSVNSGGEGGEAAKLIYLYKGMKCVLWSGTMGGNNNGNAGATGYPGTKDKTFGGHGANGTQSTTSGSGTSISLVDHQSGGGGGGAAENGTPGGGVINKNSGGGGGGSGFLAGFTNVTFPSSAVTKNSMTININRTFSVGSVVTFKSITTYVVCGGGGGGTGDHGDLRSSGGGGGAFGSGGTTYSVFNAAESTSAGSWGKGQDGSRYGAGAKGGWAYIDFSTNSNGSGTGASVSSGAKTNGFSRLYKVIPN